MKTLLSLFFFFSFSAYSLDYEFVTLEASDYRTWTEKELIDKLNDHAQFLNAYQCTNTDTHDPFWESPHMTTGNQLYLRSLNGEEFVYQKGRLFSENGNTVNLVEDTFIKLALEALSDLEKTSSGSILLRLLEKAPMKLVIRQGRFAFNPMTPNGKFWSGIKNAQAIHFLNTKRMSDGSIFNSLGSGGEILWHPTLEIKSIESDGIKRAVPPAISLAHELFHAWDSVRGLLDMRLVKGESYPFESVLEFRGVWFENQIRRELGYLYRSHYSEPNSSDDPDLLDDLGEPIYIPSYCLN